MNNKTNHTSNRGQTMKKFHEYETFKLLLKKIQTSPALVDFISVMKNNKDKKEKTNSKLGEVYLFINQYYSFYLLSRILSNNFDYFQSLYKKILRDVESESSSEYEQGMKSSFLITVQNKNYFLSKTKEQFDSLNIFDKIQHTLHYSDALYNYDYYLKGLVLIEERTATHNEKSLNVWNTLSESVKSNYSTRIRSVLRGFEILTKENSDIVIIFDFEKNSNYKLEISNIDEIISDNGLDELAIRKSFERIRGENGQ